MIVLGHLVIAARLEYPGRADYWLTALPILAVSSACPRPAGVLALVGMN